MSSCNLEFRFPPKEKMISLLKVKQIATVPVIIGHSNSILLLKYIFFQAYVVLFHWNCLDLKMSKWKNDQSWEQGRATLREQLLFKAGGGVSTILGGMASCFLDSSDIPKLLSTQFFPLSEIKDAQFSNLFQILLYRRTDLLTLSRSHALGYHQLNQEDASRRILSDSKVPMSGEMTGNVIVLRKKNF